MRKLIFPILLIFSFYCKGQSFNQMYEDSGKLKFNFDTCLTIGFVTDTVYWLDNDWSIGKPLFPIFEHDHSDTIQVSLLITEEKNKNAHIVRGYEVLKHINRFGSEIYYIDDKLKRFPSSTIIWQSK